MFVFLLEIPFKYYLSLENEQAILLIMKELLPIRALAYLSLSEEERNMLNPEIQTLKQEFQDRLSGNSRREYRLDQNRKLILSVPEQDHFGNLYKASGDIPAASYLVEIVELDNSGEMIPNNYFACALYTDGIAIVRPNLSLESLKDENMNREATASDFEKIFNAFEEADLGYNDYSL